MDNANVSINNEKSVIGAIFLENEAIEEVIPFLCANDFTDSRHQHIYEAVIKLANDRDPFDLVTVTTALKERNNLDRAGGSSYVSSLIDFVPTAANIGYYVKKVRAVSSRRKIEVLLNEGLMKLQTGEAAETVLSRIEAATLNLSMGRKGEPMHVATDVPMVLERLEAARKHPGFIPGLETGFCQLDNLAGGLLGGDFVIMAGRPSMGKTALALNMAEHIAMKNKVVAFFSLEMSRQQLAERLILGSAEVDSGQARIGKLWGDDFKRIAGTAERLSKASLMIDDTSAITIQEIRSRCIRLSKKSGLDLIVVDYLQLMRGEGDNRTQEIGAISRSLKALAKELDIPIIALSQLNRAVEQRTDKRPNLSDLRDSGEIEQDADMVWLLYRDSVYKRNADPRDAEINIAKHRRGPTGTIKLHFDCEFTRFAS